MDLLQSLNEEIAEIDAASPLQSHPETQSSPDVKLPGGPSKVPLVDVVNLEEALIVYACAGVNSEFALGLLNLIKRYPNQCEATKINNFLGLVPQISKSAATRLPVLASLGDQYTVAECQEAVTALKNRVRVNPFLPLQSLVKEGYTITTLKDGARAENESLGSHVIWRFDDDSEPILKVKSGNKPEVTYEGIGFRFSLSIMSFIKCSFSGRTAEVTLIPNFSVLAMGFCSGLPTFSDAEPIYREGIASIDFAGCTTPADCCYAIANKKFADDLVARFQRFSNVHEDALGKMTKYVTDMYSKKPTRALIDVHVSKASSYTVKAFAHPKSLRGGNSISNSLFKSYEYGISPITPGVSTFHKWQFLVSMIKKSKWLEQKDIKVNLASFGHTKEDHWSQALGLLEADHWSQYDIKPVGDSVINMDIKNFNLSSFCDKHPGVIAIMSDVQNESDMQGNEMTELVTKYTTMIKELEKRKRQYYLGFKIKWIKLNENSDIVTYRKLMDALASCRVYYSHTGTRAHNGELIVLATNDPNIPAVEFKETNARMYLDVFFVGRAYFHNIFRTMRLFIGKPVSPNIKIDPEPLAHYVAHVNSQRSQQAVSKNLQAKQEFDASLSSVSDSVEQIANLPIYTNFARPGPPEPPQEEGIQTLLPGLSTPAPSGKTATTTKLSKNKQRRPK